jgi:hypothetical protein
MPREHFIPKGDQLMRSMLITAVAAIAFAIPAFAQEDAKQGYEVHDMTRPYPAKVEPGNPSTQDTPGTAPSDAVVLFDGKNTDQWLGKDNGPVKWTIEDSQLTVGKGTGNIHSKDSYGDCQVHVEWQNYGPQEGRSQGRGNSGVFLMGLYECQVLDTYENKSYPDGIAGSLYGQFPPLVNPTRPAGQWQIYDIIFHKPIFKDGKVETPANFTVLLNGVLVQDHIKAIGPTGHMTLAHYPDSLPDTGPLELQDHGHPVRYRNIWLRPIPAKADQPLPPVRPGNPAHPH